MNVWGEEGDAYIKTTALTMALAMQVCHVYCLHILSFLM